MHLRTRRDRRPRKTASPKTPSDTAAEKPKPQPERARKTAAPSEPPPTESGSDSTEDAG